jgi:hypothetical protein
VRWVLDNWEHRCSSFLLKPSLFVSLRARSCFRALKVNRHEPCGLHSQARGSRHVHARRLGAPAWHTDSADTEKGARRRSRRGGATQRKNS